MKPMAHKPQMDLRAHLLELSEACPYDHCNPEDCPLFPLRKMPPAKRVQWLNAMGEDDLNYLAAYHYVCFTLKVESQSSQTLPAAGTERLSQ